MDEVAHRTEAITPLVIEAALGMPVFSSSLPMNGSRL